MNLKLFCFFLNILVFISQTQAQKTSAMISSESAIEDVEWLSHFIADVHIAPFSLLPQQIWNENVESLKQTLQAQESISRTELFIQLLYIFHKIKDIHLSLFLPGIKSTYINENKLILPLKVRILGDQLYVAEKNYEQMPFGSRIVKINHVNDSLIIDELRRVTPADGNNPWSQNRIAEKMFVELFPLLFQVKNFNEIEFIPPNADTVSVTKIPGFVPHKKYSTGKSQKTLKSYHEITLYKSLNTAYLSIPSFSEGSVSAYNEFLKFAFSEIHDAGVEHLILDLRNNEGGYAERGEKLLSYLIPEKTPYVTSIVFKKSKMADEIFNKQSKNSLLIKRLFVLEELLRMESRPYGSYDTVYYGTTKPTKEVFQGKLYVLINGMSVSTTGLVCNSLREFRGAFFIGEPGGFTPQGTFGQVLRFTLPNSGISGYMSTIRFNSGYDFEIDTIPFMPDVRIFEDIEDLLQNRDPVVRKTLEIIKRKQN